MKKVRRLLSLIVVLGLCSCLCGCSYLDELRASRASFTASGSVQLYDGTEYILLPACKELQPVFTEYETIYLAPEDLPLLLTSFAGDYAIKSDDGQFLQVYTGYDFAYYCRSDVYDSVVTRINEGFVAEAYCYQSFDYVLGKQMLAVLTQAQADAITQVLTDQEPETFPEAATLSYDVYMDLYLCSADQLFMQDTVDIGIIKGKYYVVSNDNDITVYSVPAELTEVFAQILEPLVEMW